MSSREPPGQHLERRPALGVDLDDDELGPVDDLALQLLGRHALAAREPGAGLGRRAVGAEGHIGARTAEALPQRRLDRLDVLHVHGDAPRRDHHLEVLVAEHLLDPEDALFHEPVLLEQRVHEAVACVVTLELRDQGEARLVGKLFAADLEQPLAHRAPSPRLRHLEVELGDGARERHGHAAM